MKERLQNAISFFLFRSKRENYFRVALFFFVFLANATFVKSQTITAGPVTGSPFCPCSTLNVPFTLVYCPVSASNSCHDASGSTFGYHDNPTISNFSLDGAYNNPSGCSSGSYADYSDPVAYPALVTTLTSPGGPYTVSVTALTADPASSYAVNVWIDLNSDGDFTDAGEHVLHRTAAKDCSGSTFPVPTICNNVVKSGNFSLPMGLTSGMKRLRVRLVYGDNQNNSCGNVSYGETEDYRVYIQGTAGGNDFIAQLSDANGSFSTPVPIGTLNDNGSYLKAGTISATIPCNTLPGTNYRIRVTNGNSSITTVDNGVNLTVNSCSGTPTITTGTIAGSPFCEGDAVSVPFNAFGTFNVGNIYTAQLSDASGSFAVPVTLGTLTSISAVGTVMGTIPGGTITGTLYRIRVVGSNPATTGADNGVNIAINAKKTVSVTVSASPNPVCTGVNVTFSATPTNGGTPTYQWKINGANAGTGAQNLITSTPTIKNGDIITVVMTSNASCIAGSPATSPDVTINVTSGVVASITISSDKTSICSGGTINFTATPGLGITSPSYQWKVGSGDFGTNSPTFSPNNLNDGDIVSCVLSSNASCVTGVPKTSNTITVSVGTGANAGKVNTLGSNNSICLGASIFLLVNGNSDTVRWQSSPINGNFTDIPNSKKDTFLVKPNQNTYYRATTGSGSCVAVSDTFELIVKPVPTSSFDFTPDAIIKGKVSFNSDGSTGAVFFDWDFDDGGATSDEPNPIYTFTKDKRYHVCLTVTNGLSCPHQICEDIDISLDINKVLADGFWKIYPVPFRDHLWINAEKNNKGIESLEIYDLLGRALFSKNFGNIQTLPLQIDLSGLSEGMYYLKIRTTDTNYFQSVIKQ